jgi:5-(carboxyamino)imidazole ribonucleotide synthase
MVFHPEHNLVDFLFSPASISAEIAEEAEGIALALIEKMGLVGVLAVEMFLTPEGEILINEVAPRPHNSGHQTIRGNETSQYEQHLRAIAGLPLGSTNPKGVSGMLNLLGEDGYAGTAKYEGLAEALAIPGVYPFLYGKKLTKPFRKMGHVTILGSTKEEIIAKSEQVKNLIRVIS